MEMSSISTSTSGYQGLLSTELFPVKRVVRPPFQQSFLVSTSLNRTTILLPSLSRRNGSLFYGENSIKVLCSQKKENPILESSSMEEVYDALAERILFTAAAAASYPTSKHIVGLAGPPGAGKSTLASEVVRRVNKLWSQKDSSLNYQVRLHELATVLSMDGFHLYRSQLDATENPEEAHARRGAPWTFSPKLLLECLKKLRNEGSVYAPSFDHSVGDPVEDDIFISPQHKIVLVEGNYLLLEEEDWKDISSMFDEKWYIDVDIEKAMQRVLRRHISTGKPPDVAKWRIDYNDRPNAELIIKTKENADLVIRSIDLIQPHK